MRGQLHFDLSCRECGFAECISAQEAARRLRTLGMLRRQADPSDELVRELLFSATDRLSCQDCGDPGLVIRPAAEDEADWPDPTPCEACGQTIPPERLELFPDSTLCAACQGKVERGEPVGGPEYCERCGWPLQLRAANSAGLARYVMRCTNPGCRG